jgi:hypothetical protein
MIGAVAAAPSNFVVNVPTTITFTIPVNAQTTSLTRVDLTRVTAGGSAIGVVARMNDRGQSGDLKAGDKVFTAQVRFTEAAVGKMYFRVGLALRGGSALDAQSPILAVDVDPLLLPPDPGEAGKQTLEGIDSDKDGVRDDVQRWIATSYPSDESLRNALSQFAKRSQAMLVSGEVSESIFNQHAEQRRRALYCLNYVQAERLTDPVHAATETSELVRVFKTVLLNTRERSKAFLLADARLSGATATMLDRSQWQNMCD